MRAYAASVVLYLMAVLVIAAGVSLVPRMVVTGSWWSIIQAGVYGLLILVSAGAIQALSVRVRE